MKKTRTILPLLIAINMGLSANDISQQKQDINTTTSTFIGKVKNNNNKLDKLILNIEKRKVYGDKRFTVHNMKIALKKNLPNNWIGYVFEIDLTANGRRFTAKDVLFTNGVEIADNVRSLKSGLDYKRLLYPTLENRYHKKEYLIAGEENAKHKMVLFSDPLCPICIRIVPEIIKKIKNNPKNISLYYISMPLKMHPTATTIVRASIVAKEQGIKDIDYKVYTARFEKDFDAYREKDQEKVLEIFNKKFGTKITMEQINAKRIVNKEKLGLKLAEKAYVNGTPTIFFDNEIDITRTKYLKYLKDDK